MWRDAKKPSTILAELCRKHGILPPEYRTSEVKILNKIFKIPPDAVPEGMILRLVDLHTCPDTVNTELYALKVHIPLCYETEEYQ